MLRLKEIDKKLEDIGKEKAVENPGESQRAYIEHLKSIEVAYQRERIKSLCREVDDKENYEDLIPKGMYR